MEKAEIEQIEQAATELTKWANNLSYKRPSPTKVPLTPSRLYKKLVLLLLGRMPAVGQSVKGDFDELDTLHQEYRCWCVKAITQDNEEEFYTLVTELKGSLYDLAKTLWDVAKSAKKKAGTQPATKIPDYKALNLAKVPISRLIEQGESYTLEFKETLDYDTQNKGKNKDILLSSLKTIAGFLNAASGTLLIGVGDSGKIKGIGRDLSLMKNGNNDKFQLKIRNCLKVHFQPQPIGKVNISFEKFPEGTICRVDVQASKDIIHLDNKVYVREGNTTQLLDGRALTDWIKQ